MIRIAITVKAYEAVVTTLALGTVMTSAGTIAALSTSAVGPADRGRRCRKVEIRQSRDGWKAQAERLALTAPIAAPPPAPDQRRPWWRRLEG